MVLNERKIDINISGLDVDDPLPAIPPSLLLSSRVDRMDEIAKRDGLTIPVLDQGLIDSRGDFAILGSLVQIPDHVQSWFEEGAVEKANFMPPFFQASSTVPLFLLSRNCSGVACQGRNMEATCRA